MGPEAHKCANHLETETCSVHGPCGANTLLEAKTEVYQELRSPHVSGEIYVNAMEFGVLLYLEPSIWLEWLS